MGIIINTNVDSLKVQRNLNNATAQASLAMERLTTGLRINNAGDDAAGLVISKGIETQQRGSEVAIKNAQNGINMLQTAEGNLAQMAEHLLAIHDLTLQAMNGGYGVTEVQALEDEALSRAQEIDRIANSAMFNEFKLFDKTIDATDPRSDLLLQIGTNSDKDTNTITITKVFYNAELSTLTGGTISSTGTNQLAFVDKSGADPAIQDRASFEALLDNVKVGIKEISARRGVIGASSIRLNAAVDNLTIQNENLSAANSRIKDADIAKESSNYTNKTILQQASASLLVQANQAPSIALTLI